MKTVQKNAGVTLLEMLLVFAIASSLFLASYQWYNQYRIQAAQAQLLANVDQLFLAMQQYYRANCRQGISYVTGVKSSAGALDPVTTNGNLTVTLKIKKLETPGYLITSSWHPTNFLVDNTPTDKGYYLQFNAGSFQTTNAFACTDNNYNGTTSIPRGATPSACNTNNTTPLNASFITPTTQTTPPTPPPKVQVGPGQVITWRLQVAVKLASNYASQKEQATLLQQLGAECISQAGSSAGPVPACETTPSTNPGGYLVWERSATFISNNTTNYWITQPMIKQFNMQYTNDSMQLLNEPNYQKFSNGDTSQYYLCGE